MRFKMGVGWVGWILFLGLIFSVADADDLRYDKGQRRDPFQPLIGPHAYRMGREMTKDAFPIVGIVYDPKKGSYAIVGGEIYREGQNLDGAKLIKILGDRLILQQESKEVIVWLREEILETGKKNSKE